MYKSDSHADTGSAPFDQRNHVRRGRTGRSAVPAVLPGPKLAAEFYAQSPGQDRYWFVESLLTAYLAGSQSDAPEAELLLLFKAITREAPYTGRSDKAELSASDRSGAAKLEALLAD
jgi:hypothetical protein